MREASEAKQNGRMKSSRVIPYLGNKLARWTGCNRPRGQTLRMTVGLCTCALQKVEKASELNSD